MLDSQGHCLGINHFRSHLITFDRDTSWFNYKTYRLGFWKTSDSVGSRIELQFDSIFQIVFPFFYQINESFAIEPEVTAGISMVLTRHKCTYHYIPIEKNDVSPLLIWKQLHRKMDSFVLSELKRQHPAAIDCYARKPHKPVIDLRNQLLGVMRVSDTTFGTICGHTDSSILLKPMYGDPKWLNYAQIRHLRYQLPNRRYIYIAMPGKVPTRRQYRLTFH